MPDAPAPSAFARITSPVLPLLGGLFLMIALALAVGGAWLAMLGGSWYYLVAALGFALAGVSLMRRATAALWWYALLFAASLGWSIWEAGLDWWPLAARMDLLFVLGVLLLLPAVTRRFEAPMHRSDDEARVQGRTRALPSEIVVPRSALAIPMVAFVLVAVLSWFHDPHELEGVLPATIASPQAAEAAASAVPAGEWHSYGRTGFGQRYSPLDQITPLNVAKLEPAWRFDTGDRRGRPGDPVETTDEVTPLKIGERLFLCTPHQSVIALDATTGAQLWRRDLPLPPNMALQHLTCRGLAYWPGDGATPADAAPAGAAAACGARLFMATADGGLHALDPRTGASCAGFGTDGRVDLWANMPNPQPGSYYATSPAVVTRDRVIVGGTVLDNVSTREQSGVIRAFDVRTGALRWNWDSGNPGDTAPIAPGGRYTVNSPNSWSISSVDEALGMVYVPLGNQPPDQWGGHRSAAVETYSSSVVALDLANGRVRWVFQTVHHDLWDYDVPAQPSLVDLQIGADTVPALVQPTKQGELFVLDRRTGQPVKPVTEKAAPQGAAAGDRSAPTQPVSQLSFDPPPLEGRDMWGATLFDQLACRIALKRLRYEGRFTPPSEQGSLVYPGNFGVFNWGGIAVDPARQVAFATPTYLAFVSQLVPRPDATALMVQDTPPSGGLPALNENFGAPFAVRLKPFLSPIGIPCQSPPWGYVAGIDLAAGSVSWRHRNGTVRDLSPLPLPFKMGVPNLGGPLITAGGVAFLSGTMDDYVRGYELTSGRQVWESRLPAGGQATPMTYTGADGRQYLLVVAGGHGSTGTRAGDSVIAYALPAR